MENKLLLSFFIAFLMLSACTETPKPASETVTGTLSEKQIEEYTIKGKSIALATFATLSAKLGAALQEGSVSKAVEVCNIAAMPLVDSLSGAYNASIRRTSLKIRNPQNKATDDELKILESYSKEIQARKSLQPRVEEMDGIVTFYAPILTQELCLKCHGKIGETLNVEDYDLIKTLYPLDQAIGYAQEDLRGIWSIKFEK